MVLSVTTQNNARPQHQTTQTDWNICQKLQQIQNKPETNTTTVDIDNEIESLVQSLWRFLRNATPKTPNDQSSPAKPILHNGIKDRNEHRRKFQKMVTSSTSYTEASSQISSANTSRKPETKYGRTNLQTSRRRTTHFGRPSKLPAP